MNVTMDKKYVTMGGKAVRIVAINVQGDYPVIGIVRYSSGNETVYQYTRGGMSAPGESTLNLIEIKEKVALWLNVYPDGSFGTHPSESEADTAAFGRTVIIRARRVELEVD